MQPIKPRLRPTLKNNRRSFTLLEIMLALLVLVTAAGFIGWNVKNLIEDYRFRDEVTSFYHDLEVAQLCALALHSEIKVQLLKEKGTWKARFLTDEMILEKWSQTESSLQHVADIENGKDLTIDANGKIHMGRNLSFLGKHRRYHIDGSQPFIFRLIPGDQHGTEKLKI